MARSTCGCLGSQRKPSTPCCAAACIPRPPIGSSRWRSSRRPRATSARARVGLVAPYLAFMRQDSQFHPGEGVTASTSRGWCRARSTGWSRSIRTSIASTSLDERLLDPDDGRARGAGDRGVDRDARSTQPVLVGPDAESEQWVAAVAERVRRAVRDPRRRPGAAIAMSRCPRRARDVERPHAGADRRHRVDRPHDDRGDASAARGGQRAADVRRDPRGVRRRGATMSSSSPARAGIVTCNTIPHASNRICVADPIAAAVRAYL